MFRRRLVKRVAFSLRGKLLLLAVGLVAVSGLIFGVTAIQATRRALEVAIGRQLAEIAHDSAAELSERLLREQKTVRAWTRHDLFRGDTPSERGLYASRFLDALRAEDSDFLDVRCVALDGTVLAANNTAYIGARDDTTAWRAAVVAGSDFMAGPLELPGAQRPVVQIVVPISGSATDPEIYGALVALHDWDRLTAVMGRIQRNSRRHKLPVNIVLLDESGTVISEAPPAHGAAQLHRNLTAAGWRTARELPVPRPGYWRDPVPDAVVGFAPLGEPRPGWSVLVSQPLHEALAPAYRLQRRLTVLLAAILISGVTLALVFAERLLRPLRALRRATRTLASSGHLPVPLPATSRDEIGELTVAFNRMATQLSSAQRELVDAAKFAFVGEVAAGVAHEVRTPLGIMRSSAQILRRSMVNPRPEDTELMDMIIDEVDRLDRVVAQLLELARPHEPLIEATRLEPILDRAADFIDGRAREAGITVRREIDRHTPPAQCDPEQIYQVVLNLLVNAVQALGRGGEIVLSSTRGPNGYVGFAVRDNGPGIPEALQERVFTPFFTRRQGGTGLGLAFVQRIVQAHRGQVTLKSEAGAGATFRVDLPQATEEV